jgi:hypothetical protein
MKHLAKLLFVTALGGILASCTVLPRARLDVRLYSPVDPANGWQPGEVVVERKTLDGEIARMVPQALRPLAHARGLPLLWEESGPLLALDISIVEREFTRDLETLNSILYCATLREVGTGKSVAQAMYAEESRETLASFYHLYCVTELVLKGLSDGLLRRAGEGGKPKQP